MSNTRGDRVGVIGLGVIGSGVARALHRAGMDLAVCDVRDEAVRAFADVAGVASSPSGLGPGCRVVVVAVVDDEQLDTVVAGPEGFLSTSAPGSTLVVVSTVRPSTVRDLASRAADRAVRVVDCGVSGGSAAASEGRLVSMVGGDAADVESVRAVIEAFSSTVVHVGPLGAGIQAKLARNLIQYGSWLAAYEGQLVAEAAGIPLETLARIVRESDALIGGVSTLMLRPTVAPFGPDDDPGFVDAMRAASGLARKDLGAVVELAVDLGVEAPVAALALESCSLIFGVGT